jgi:hypothetical protein
MFWLVLMVSVHSGASTPRTDAAGAPWMQLPGSQS